MHKTSSEIYALPELVMKKSKSYRDDFGGEEVLYDPNSEQSFCFSFLYDFVKLYHYAQSSEKVAIGFGVVIGVLSGASHPAFIYLWFQILELAIENKLSQDNVGVYLKAYFGLGCGVLFINTILFATWKYISQSVSKRIRIRYLEEFAKQSLANVEKRNGYQWASDFRMHTLNIEKSIGDKVALFLNLIGITTFGVTAALVIRWTFTLELFIVAPIGAFILAYFIHVQIKKREVQADANKEAQNKALQATAMAKTVKMLGGQDKEAEEYQQKLLGGQDKLHEFGKQLGLSTSLFYFILNILIGVGFIMGLQCIKGTDFCPVSVTGSRYRLDEFLTVFFQTFFCVFNFLQLGSNYSAIKSAILSSRRIYKFIEKPKITKQEQVYRPQAIGKIVFRNIIFSYPLNRQKIILNGLSLEFQQFKFNAIAGVTGSGKSTIIQLLMKQYYPEEGTILVDKIPLDEINTSHWLGKIGIVTQEPTLFEGTIRENVQVGKPDASDLEIREALQNANILEFVESLDEGLDFEIGAGGSKLSGGQKQRIAIARALVKKPELLILDQATSALDPRAEKEIQASLERIRHVFESRMTIVCIAHRLRTIKNADMIFLIQNGVVAESGKFDDLEYFKSIRMEEQAGTRIDQTQLSIKATLISALDVKENHQLKVPGVSDSSRNLITEANLVDEDKLGKFSPKKTSIYIELYSYTKQHGWYIICIIIAAVTGINHNITALLITYSANQMVKLYLYGTGTDWCSSASVVYDDCNSQLTIFLYQSEKYLYGIIGFSVFVLILYLIKIIKLTQIENEISFNLRKGLYKKLLNLEVRFFEKAQNQSGQAASQFSNDSRDCSVLLTSYVPIIVQNFCCAVAAVVVCLIFQWKFGFLSMLITPMIALSFYIAMLFIGGFEDSSLQQRQRADQIANELIANYKTVLVLDYQERLLAKYRNVISEPFRTTLITGAKIGLLYGSGHLILDFVVGIALYVAITIARYDSTIQTLSILMFMITSVYSGFIIGNNFFFISHTTTSQAAGQRIMELINAKTEEEVQAKHRKISGIHLGLVKGRIEFRNVNFKYKNDDSKAVLKNVSFTIEAGSKVAFVGPSGCGKSTLLQLLLRYYEFQGQILLDGENIFNYDLQSYRKHFAVLNQDPHLFAGTIDENIRYSNDQISEQRIRTVCERSCAFWLSGTESLPDRMNKFRARKVGPKGSNISGGEKQRAACARALARGGTVFLMDEGTSALDRRTELKLQTGVNEEFAGRTVINVAHRIETIADSDVIFVFDNGRLKEMGNYSQLMMRQGYFYNFTNGNKSHE